MRRLIALVSVALLVLAAGQAVSAQSAPTENECRPHIEKALKELTEPAVDATPSQAEGGGDVAAPSSSEEDDVGGDGGEVIDADANAEATPDDGDSEESSVEMMQSDAAADETTDAAQGEEDAEASQEVGGEADSVEATGDAAEGESVESAEETAEGEDVEAAGEAADEGSVESVEEVTDGGSVESVEEATDGGSVESVEEATDGESVESVEGADGGSVESVEGADGGSVESVEGADGGSVESVEGADGGSVESVEEATDGGSVESVEGAAEGESAEADDGDVLSRGRREATDEAGEELEGAEVEGQAEGADSVEGDSHEGSSEEEGTQDGDSNEEDQRESQEAAGADASLEQTDEAEGEKTEGGEESSGEASESDGGEDNASTESAEQAEGTESAESVEGGASSEEAGGEEQAAEGDADSVEATGEDTADEASTEAAEAEGEASSEEDAEGGASSETAEAVDEEAPGEASPEGDASVEEVESTGAASSETEEAADEAVADEEASAEVEGAAQSGEATEGDASTESSEGEAAADEAAESAEEPEAAAEDATEEAAEPAAPVDEEEAEPTPEEELSFDVDIPENLRPRDHIAQILRLDEDSVEDELLQAKTAEATLKELKRFYDSAIKPLEILYKYRDLSNRHFGDPEIFSKPLVLFMGPWSGGKSSIINYLLDNEYKRSSLRTGAEPSPAYFNILMWGEREEVLDGTQLAADWTFSGLQKFGQGLLDRLRGLRLNNRLLEKVNIVEIPGILEIRKQVERLFPFNDACQWFIDRADIIFLVYDPAKLDVGPETEAILDQLKGREYQTRIVLNKADQVRPEELMRVQGTLIWNISPLMSSTQPPVMYSTSLWSMPYEIGAPLRLLRAQERAFLRDMRDAIDHRVENKIASARRFAVRVRNHAKMVDCYLTTYYNHKSFFGNRKKVADDIIEKPQDYHIYEGLSTLTNISRYDLPDPETYRDFFRVNPLYEFELLASTCTYFKGCPINRLDVTIAYELPELVGKYKKAADAAAAKAEPKS